jgi:hypothetical protein
MAEAADWLHSVAVTVAGCIRERPRDSILLDSLLLLLHRAAAAEAGRYRSDRVLLRL